MKKYNYNPIPNGILAILGGLMAWGTVLPTEVSLASNKGSLALGREVGMFPNEACSVKQRPTSTLHRTIRAESISLSPFFLVISPA